MNGTLKLSPEAASYALAMLVSNGYVRRGQIEEVMRQKDLEIDRLRAQIKELEAIGGIGHNGPRPKAKKGPNISGKTKAFRRLQGRYMGLVRYLTAQEKERVKAAVQSRGLEYAVGIAQKLSDRRKKA